MLIAGVRGPRRGKTTLQEPATEQRLSSPLDPPPGGERMHVVDAPCRRAAALRGARGHCGARQGGAAMFARRRFCCSLQL